MPISIRRPPAWLLALALILLVLIPVARRDRVQPLGGYDQEFYIGIAYDLLHHGRLTDGFSYAAPSPSGEHPPGMRFAPLYPALIAAAETLEPGFRTAADCVAEHYDTYPACPNEAHLVRTTQTAMLAAVFLMAWWLARVFAGPRGAWIGLAIVLATAPYLMRTADYAMTEMTALFLSTAATCAAIAATRSPRVRTWTVATGLLLGLLALTRPAFLYLFDAAILAGLVHLAWAGRARWRPRALLLALFAAGFAVPVAPWVARNAIVLDRPALSFGYASHTLVQRISYNAVTWPEYAMFYVCGLPDGTSLGQRIAGPGACDRFGLDLRPAPSTRSVPAPCSTKPSRLRAATTTTSPTSSAPISSPTRSGTCWSPSPWPSAAPGSTTTGASCSPPLCLVLTIVACRRRDTAFLLLATPAWFMLAFNAAIAVNQVRYNLMLVIPYAVTGAILLDRLLARREQSTASASD